MNKYFIFVPPLIKGKNNNDQFRTVFYARAFAKGKSGSVASWCQGYLIKQTKMWLHVDYGVIIQRGHKTTVFADE